MKFLRTLVVAASLIIPTAALMPVAVAAQNASAAPAVSYAPGSVWETSRIEILPGQFQNYMDWLKNNWKPNMEFLKAEGWLLSYHVLTVNERRDGEPHMILVQEWRDYPTIAQNEELNNKWLARQRSNPREAATQNGARQVMRIGRGGMQLQELVLK
jgi:hypothetical protein